MNRIVASVGLVALGAASVHAQSPIAPPAPKWWSVSATVRGFYDDNADTAPSGSPRIGTFGYELDPGIAVSLGNDQTTFTASYQYSYIYYEKRLTPTVVNGNNVPGLGDKSDQDHIFSMALEHAFSERYSLHIGDSFVVGQQPDTLRAGNDVVAFYRISGQNIVNAADVVFAAQLTPRMDLQAGYNNGWYDYDATELSGPLNRIENYAHLDARWHVSPSTVGVLGYQFGDVVYTGSGAFAFIGSPTGESPVSIRNTISHTVYVGLDHSFSPQLTGSIRAGGTYYDYYNDPNNTSDFGPYASASLTYTYGPESFLSLGFQEQRSAASLTGPPGEPVIHDTEASVLFGSITHRILPRFYGTLKGTFENSSYNGGGPGIDGKSERFYEAALDFEYRFNANFSANVGYAYDKLDSELVGSPSYDRNKVYIGATAKY